MKKSSLIFLAATGIFCALSFAACSSNSANQNNSSGSANNSNNANANAVSANANAVEIFDEKSPMGVAKILSEAAKKNDMETIKKNVSGASAKFIEQRLKEKDPEVHASLIEHLSTAEIKEGVSSGNTFIVCVNNDPRPFVKENAEWKYDFKTKMENAGKELEKQMDIMEKQGQNKGLEYREQLNKRDEAQCSKN